MVYGYVLALVTLLLLGFVLPRMHARHTVLADAPLQERFSENLRIVREPRMAIEGQGDHGKIFMTERKMTTNAATPTGGAKKARRHLPALARERSRAKARISARGAGRARGILAGAVLAFATLVAWLVVGLTSVPMLVAIISTILAGGYVLGFGYVLSVWEKADDADLAVVEKANRALATAKRRKSVLNKNSAKTVVPSDTVSSQDVAISDFLASDCEMTNGATQSADASVRSDRDVATASVASAPVANSTGRAQGESANSAGSAQGGRPTSSAKKAVKRSVPAPSYTLKPAFQKRTVKPYEAPEVAQAPVPYRPKAVGERLGDAVLESANPAPQMTGQEEVRTDLLGGGAALDKLLEQRRA